MKMHGLLNFVVCTASFIFLYKQLINFFFPIPKFVDGSNWGETRHRLRDIDWG